MTQKLRSETPHVASKVRLGNAMCPASCNPARESSHNGGLNEVSKYKHLKQMLGVVMSQDSFGRAMLRMFAWICRAVSSKKSRCIVPMWDRNMNAVAICMWSWGAPKRRCDRKSRMGILMCVWKCGAVTSKIGKCSHVGTIDAFTCNMCLDARNLESKSEHALPKHEASTPMRSSDVIKRPTCAYACGTRIYH
jgi:hypothetical protein